MERLMLTAAQTAQVKRELDEYKYEDGHFDIDIDLGEVTLNAVGEVTIYGYFENNYCNGTGAWIETNRDASITVTAMNEEGVEYEVDATEFETYLSTK